jgi:hypothetical protein
MAMKKALSLLVIIIPLLCCSKISRIDVIKYDKVFEYNFVTDGNKFPSVKTFTRQQLMSKLGLPEDAQILSVEIEGLEFNVKAASDNVTRGAIVAASVKVSTMEKPIVRDTKITIDRSGNIWKGWTPLSLLASEGVGLLKSQITDWVNKYSSVESITMTAFATPDPANSGRLSIDFDLKLKATVKYRHCVDSPKLLGGEGIECEKALLN